MTELNEGDSAPDFTLPRSGGGEVSLSDFRGRKVVLYFYPADDTPGCTKEACQLRDANEQIEAANATVLGVSPDGVSSHDRFIAKYGLPFVLLADADHAVAERYGAWTERNLYGRKFMGIQRSTFLIDEQGRIEKIWPRVRADGHAAEVLAALHL
jgi:peroxiredoxin Q/BCP